MVIRDMRGCGMVERVEDKGGSPTDLLPTMAILRCFGGPGIAKTYTSNRRGVSTSANRGTERQKVRGKQELSGSCLKEKRCCQNLDLCGDLWRRATRGWRKLSSNPITYGER